MLLLLLLLLFFSDFREYVLVTSVWSDVRVCVFLCVYYLLSN